MKIKFLGTGAYEGVPALFCKCDVCVRSQKAGGRNLRTRSQALIDDDLLIDFPPDTVAHFLKYGFDTQKIENCLITHSHSDHFYPEDMEIARKDYVHGHERTVNFYADGAAYNIMTERFNRAEMRDKLAGAVTANRVEVGKVIEVGRYSVMAVRANHAPWTSPVVYAISDGNSKLLYGNDSGYFTEEGWGQLKSFCARFGKFDLVSLDCTCGINVGKRDNHQCFETNLQVFDRMESEGMIDGSTQRLAHHFSHNGGSTYGEMAEIAKPYGITVTYDGYETEC